MRWLPFILLLSLEAGCAAGRPALDGSTLVVDEMPGRLVGDDEGPPPGRVLHVAADGTTLFETLALKMPYDAVREPGSRGSPGSGGSAGSGGGGTYLVALIRARAIARVNAAGEVVAQIPAGGYPCSLELLANGNVLVAGWDDGAPGFVRELDPRGSIVWRLEDLTWPWKAQRLASGNTLVADAGRRRVFEVAPNGTEVWAADGLGPDPPRLFDALGPVYAQRLPCGNTLVSIRGESRVVELDPAGRIVWEVGPPLLATQYSAVRLASGHTLIADQGHRRVIEIDPAGRIVRELGPFGYPAKAYRVESAPR